jgi:DoxX-like family
MNIVLWIIQVILALLFLLAGGTKLILPIAEMTKDIHLPGLFLRFLGVAEVLGALGLILPGALRIKPGLTSLAAVGLMIIVIGATVITATNGPIVGAILPFITTLLLAFVAYGRWRIAPSAARGK